MKALPHLLIASLLVSACARTEPADTTNGQEAELAEQTLDETPEDPTTPGSWEAAAQGQNQSVVFRSPDGDAIFTISCDLRGGLVVQRPGLVARGNLALMQLRTADVVRRLAVNAGAGAEPQVEARVPYNDQLIPALMSFDEPLEVRYESLQTLVLPPNPIVSDLVRTCQQTSAAAAQVAEQAGAPAGNSAEPAGEQPQQPAAQNRAQPQQ